jgi:hypothetical protein
MASGKKQQRRTMNIYRKRSTKSGPPKEHDSDEAHVDGEGSKELKPVIKQHLTSPGACPRERALKNGVISNNTVLLLTDSTGACFYA